MQRPLRILHAEPVEVPISTLNTTPLIDVLLVLLIMFIVTIPIASHKVAVDLPASAPVAPDRIQMHELALDAAGRLSWDGAPVAESALPARLESAHASEPDMVLRLRADGRTRYEAFDRILATVKRSPVDRLAFVGNEAFKSAIG